MRILRAVGRSCLVLILAVAVLSTNLLAQNFSVENHKLVGSLLQRNGKTVGTCFFIDDRGYIATCISNLPTANQDVVVLFPNGHRFQISGIVAASPGKDIAIAKIEPDNKESLMFSTTLRLDTDAQPEIDEELVPWGGPSATPLEALLPLPRVKRKLLGDDFTYGAIRKADSRLGSDPTTEWIWLTVPRHRSCNGGPVFNRSGDVVAMLSGCLTQDVEVFSAVHAKHINALIPTDTIKPKPLISLKNWMEETPTIVNADSARADLTLWADLGGTLRRGDSLVERLKFYQNRLLQVQEERVLLQKHRSRYQSDNLELLAKYEAVEGQLKKYIPEEKYEVEVKADKDEDDNGKKSRRVTRYRFSQRQKELMKPIEGELKNLQIAINSNSLSSDYDLKISEPFINHFEQRIVRDFFYLSDPLALRAKQEHIDLEKALSELIDEGGAEGDLYVARAVLRCQLRDFAGCESDLNEAVEGDTKFRPLASALELRMMTLRQDSKAPGRLKILSEEAKSNPHALVILARIDLDIQNIASAVRRLQNASKISPHELEIQHGLAWLSPGAPSKATPTAPKSIIAPAVQLVHDTGGLDWSARAALASAYAETKDLERAREQMKQAIDCAPSSAIDTCKRWLNQLNNSQRIERNWSDAL